MKVFRLLFGIVFLFCTLSVLYYMIAGLAGYSVVGVEIVDSIVDKIFYSMLMMGLAVVCALAAVGCFRNIYPPRDFILGSIGQMAFCFAVMGMFYAIVGSPW
ncbi:MAG: hypothetical protein QG583_443 [Patescibacteria group bacterium]|nr:hypothetical protein [Patescibacteria group bacterium]